MQKKLSRAVKKVINESLPEVTAGVLQERLDMIPELEAEVKSLEDVMKKLESNIEAKDKIIASYVESSKEMQSKIAKMRDLEQYAANLQQEQELINDQRRSLETEMLRIKLESAEKRSEFAESVLGIVFKAGHTRREFVSSLHKEDIKIGDYNSNTGIMEDKIIGKQEDHKIQEDTHDE